MVNWLRSQMGERRSSYAAHAERPAYKIEKADQGALCRLWPYAFPRDHSAGRLGLFLRIRKPNLTINSGTWHSTYAIGGRKNHLRSFSR